MKSLVISLLFSLFTDLCPNVFSESTVDQIPSLLKALKDKNSDVRENALKQLDELGPRAPKAVPGLIDALGDQDNEISKEVPFTLAKIGTPALPFLIRAIANENVEVQIGVITAFRAMGPKAITASPVLIKSLKESKEPRIRYEVVTALLAIHDKKAIPTLIQVMKTDTDDEVRQCCAWALGGFKEESKQLIPVLIEAMNDEKLRGRASIALTVFGSSSVPALLRVFQDSKSNRREDAANALFRLQEEAKGALPVLIKTLDDPDAKIRQWSAEILGRIGPDPKEVLPALTRGLNDKCVMVRIKAAGAIFHIDENNQGVVPVLLQALRDKDKSVRFLPHKNCGGLVPKPNPPCLH